jgi:hypothetical protein
LRWTASRRRWSSASLTRALMSKARRRSIAAAPRRQSYHPLVCWLRPFACTSNALSLHFVPHLHGTYKLSPQPACSFLPSGLAPLHQSVLEMKHLSSPSSRIRNEAAAGGRGRP